MADKRGRYPFEVVPLGGGAEIVFVKESGRTGYPTRPTLDGVEKKKKRGNQGCKADHDVRGPWKGAHSRMKSVSVDGEEGGKDDGTRAGKSLAGDPRR